MTYGSEIPCHLLSWQAMTRKIGGCCHRNFLYISRLGIDWQVWQEFSNLIVLCICLGEIFIRQGEISFCGGVWSKIFWCIKTSGHFRQNVSAFEAKRLSVFGKLYLPFRECMTKVVKKGLFGWKKVRIVVVFLKNMSTFMVS